MQEKVDVNISIYCFVENNGKILLSRDVGKNGWKVAGGCLEKDESLYNAALREVKEETGLEIISIDKYVGHFDYQSASGLLTRQLNFLVSTAPSEIKINPLEHSRYILSSLADLNFQGLNISDEVLETIKAVL